MSQSRQSEPVMTSLKVLRLLLLNRRMTGWELNLEEGTILLPWRRLRPLIVPISTALRVRVGDLGCH